MLVFEEGGETGVPRRKPSRSRVCREPRDMYTQYNKQSTSSVNIIVIKCYDTKNVSKLPSGRVGKLFKAKGSLGTNLRSVQGIMAIFLEVKRSHVSLLSLLVSFAIFRHLNYDSEADESFSWGRNALHVCAHAFIIGRLTTPNQTSLLL